MTTLDTNPVYQALLAAVDQLGRKMTTEEFSSFIRTMMTNDVNMRVEGSVGAILYRGVTTASDGTPIFNGKLAAGLAERSDGKLATLDNTFVGQVLEHVDPKRSRSVVSLSVPI